MPTSPKGPEGRKSPQYVVHTTFFNSAPAAWGRWEDAVGQLPPDAVGEAVHLGGMWPGGQMCRGENHRRWL